MNENHPRRCTAHSSQTGERCKRSAIRGGNVCASHGGRARHVKAKARERLDALVLPAIQALRDAIRSDDVNATIRAAVVVLDRCGFASKSEIKADVLTSQSSQSSMWDDLPVEGKRELIALLEKYRVPREERRLLEAKNLTSEDARFEVASMSGVL
jgi:hypothetical protein